MILRPTAVLLAFGLSLALPELAGAETVNFEKMAAGAPPPGFTVATGGPGKPATWIVQPDPAGGLAVTQTSVDKPGMRFPLLIKDGVSATDLDLSVKYKALAGEEDQAAGLVWRYRDKDHYYIVRANALEDNVVLYKVEKGRRIDLPLVGKGKTYGAKDPVPKKVWNTLSVKVRGNLFEVSNNGKVLYQVEDKTFQGPGGIGLWTKADSVTMFDDFTWTVVK